MRGWCGWCWSMCEEVVQMVLEQEGVVRMMFDEGVVRMVPEQV